MHFHHNTHTDIFITVEFQYRLHLKAFRTLGREGGKGVIRQADIRLILRGVRVKRQVFTHIRISRKYFSHYVEAVDSFAPPVCGRQ